MTRIILIVNTLLIAFLAHMASADRAWDELRFGDLPRGKKYKVSMGSGFFINHNHIVTNRHVVSRCLNITIRGAVKPSKAKLVVLDQELDLALLRSNEKPSSIPYLRVNYDEIEKKDILFTAGYPLENSKTGNLIIKSSEVIDVSKNPRHGFTSLKIKDVIDHGNSGGPLLDKNSNIVGVVTAEMRYYKRGERRPTRTIGLAIGLDGLIDFLNKNNARFAANSTYDIFTNHNPRDLVEDYIVNIHCIKE